MIRSSGKPVDEHHVRLLYVREVEGRIDRWARAVHRLQAEASLKDPPSRTRLDEDIRDAQKVLEELRAQAGALKSATGVGWNVTTSAISRLWDKFQVVYEGARARL